MKKQLHFSALLFTTLLLLFAFPQVGRGQGSGYIALFLYYNNSSPVVTSGSIGPVYNWFNNNSKVNMSGVTSIIIKPAGGGTPNYGELDQAWIDLLKKRIKEAAATLTKVDLGGGNNIQIKDATDLDLSGLFEGCEKLDSVTMCSIDKTCTNLNNCFKGCKQLKKIEFRGLPNDPTSCEGMFQGCTNLEKIIGAFSSIKSTTWKNAFNGCSKLAEIELGFANNFNADGLVGTFKDCSKLVFVDLSGVPSINNPHLYLDFTFQNCQSLQAVFLPSNTIADDVSMKYTFQNCIALNQRKTDPAGYASQSVSYPANIEWRFAPDMNANGGEVDPPFYCYGIDIGKLQSYMKLDDDRPTPFVTCNTGKNIVIDGKANKIGDGEYYLLTNDVANEFIGQYIESPKFTLPATGKTYTLATAFSTSDDVLNDHFSNSVVSAVVVTNPKLASPATFYLTIENRANGSAVPNVVDIDNDVVHIKDPRLASDIEVYTSGTTALLDINSNPIQFDNNGTPTTIYTTTGSGALVTIPAGTTLYGEFHLTTNKAYALQDVTTNPEFAVTITDLPGEYYLVPDPSSSTATLVLDNSGGSITVSDNYDLEASLPQPENTDKAYFYVDKSTYNYYGLVDVTSSCSSMGEVASVGYTKPGESTASGVYFLTPKSLASLFPATAFVKVPEDPNNPGYYYIQSGVEYGTNNTCVQYPDWEVATSNYCGIYNINKLKNITSLEGTFDGCTTLVFGEDNGIESKIAGSAGNFCKQPRRLNCNYAFRGVKSFGIFKNNISWTDIDLTMFKDIKSLNSTFRNGGTKVQFYTGTQADWSDAQGNPVDMQYAFCGHTGYQPYEVLDVPFKNISSLYRAFGQGCTIGNICFNSEDQDALCHIQRAFDGNKGLTKLNNATLENFKRFRSLYSYSFDKKSKHPNRLTYTFAHCDNLKSVDGDWLSKPADGELELLYTFIQCVNLEDADLSGIMDYTKSLDGTFDQCAGLLTCILGERDKPLSMSSTFWGNKSLTAIDLGRLQCITNLAQTFQNCENLTNIDFGYSHTKNYTNSVGQIITIALCNTFSGCKNLGAIDLTALTPYLSNTSCTTYTTIGCDEAPRPADNMRAAFENTFNGCTALQTVKFANGVNENSIGMPSTFLGCKKLLIVENLTAFKHLTDLNQTFSGCEALAGAAFYNGDDAKHSVLHLYRTFFNCRALTDIDLGSISNKLTDAAKPTAQTLAFGQTFFGCEALKMVKFGKDTDPVKNNNPVSMCGTFYGCKALTDVKKIDKFTNITNLSQTFSGCAALQDVSFIGSVVNNKSSIGLFETFKGCKSITSIDLSGLTARLADQTEANFFQANNNEIINGAFAAFEGTFDGCTELTKVEFDKETSDGTSTNSLTNENPIGMPGTFSGCTNLTKVENLTAFTHLTQLNHTFYGCSQLDGIQFCGTSTAQHAAPMSLAGTFTNCSALTAITLPFVIGEQSISQTRGSTTSSVTYSAFGDNPGGNNPNKTFVGCTSLKKVEFLSSGNIGKVNLDNLFLNLSSLQYVINFNFSDVKNGSLENTFSGCSALLKEDPNINYELTLPKANGQTMLLKNTFNGCTALAEMRLRYSDYQAEGLVGTFRGCTSLTLVELVSSKSAVSMEDAFNGCSNLQQVNNFVGLTNVTSLVRTFADCKQLATLEFGFNPTNLASADETFNGTNSDCTKRLQCDWDRHQWWIDEYTNNKTASYNPNSFIFEDRSATTPEIVFDCDMFDVKPQLEADGNRVVEFVNVVKDGTAYTPDATGKYLVAGTDTCGAITVTATQITDIKLTASGTYDFHYRTENSGKGHCNKQAAINLTLGNSDKHDVVGTVCEDEEFTWNIGLGSTAIVLTPTDYNAPVSAAPPTNGSRLKLSKGSAIIDATGKKSREETYKYYKQVKNIAGKACEESSTLTLTVRLLDTITTTVTDATCVCSTLSYAWTVENGNIITINESAFGGAATSSSWTRTNNPNGHVMFEHKGVDTSDPHSCNTVYRLVFEKPYTPIDETKTATVTHCQEYAYQWDLTPANEYLTLSGADFDPTSTAWKLSVNAINSPSHTYDTSKDNLILYSERSQSAIVNEMVTYMFTVKLKNANTCVDTYTLNLPVKLTHRNEQTDTICEDANYEWRDAGKMIATLDKSDFGQCLNESQYGKYQKLTHGLEPNIEKMVVRTYTDNGRRFREEIYKYYAQRENCAEGKCEISDSLILTVELVDTITTTVKDATCVCPGLAYQWTVENDAVITIDEAAFAPSATSALWTRTDNPSGSVTFEHSGTINGHLCATVYQLIFDNPTKPINDEKTDKSCESKPYKWDLGSSGAAIVLSGNDFVNAPMWTVSAFTSSGTYSAVTSAERTLKAQLPATEQMTFTYKVTLHNNQTACEDTYTLDLTVQQTHREQTTAQVCANVDYELKNTWGEVVLTLGENEYSMGDVAANPFSTAGGSGTFSKTILPGGTQRYVVSKTGGTRYGCLEEYTLDLTVNPVYDERPGGADAANATTGVVCQNEDFVWNIAGDALVSAITLTYADYNQTATTFASAGQQLQLQKTTSGATQYYMYKGADKTTHCDRFYYLTLDVSSVIDQTLYGTYTDATQMTHCSDQTYVWIDNGFSYYLDSVQFYRPDGVYTDNGITIEQTTISATPWIVQFVATVPSGSCQAKYKLLLALDDRFAANLVLANTVTDAVCNGSSYVWNYGSGESVTVSPSDPDYPAFPAGGQIKRRVSVPGASGCNDYYYLDLTINPSDHRTMTIDAVCRDENYFSYTGFPINEIVDFDASDLPADVKTYTHTVAHDCDQMTITFNFKEPERCQGKIVEGLVINQYECWLLMVNHNQLPLRDQEPVAYQWYVCHNTAPGDPNFLRNSNPIDGANKDFYTETQTLTGGYYWVKVTYIVGDEEFYYRSEPAALTCTDALEVVTTTDLMLSPNPVKQGSVVLIDGDALDVSAGAHIDVYTTAGQRVRSFDIATRAFKADVPAGCYLVQISVDRQTIVTAKMVVQ